MQRWCTVEQCLWVEETALSDISAMANTYPDLTGFFVGSLKMKKLSIDMLVKDVVHQATSEPLSVELVKSLLLEINLMRPQPEDLRSLTTVPMTPVKQPNGTVSLCLPTSRFLIEDDPNLAAIFLGTVPVLDFDMYEAHEMRSFLSSMRWESRFMSHCAVHDTMSGNSSFNHRDTTNFRRRALALFK